MRIRRMILAMAALAAVDPALAQSPPAMPDPAAAPYYAAVTLKGGFKTDPLPIGVIAGGSFSVAKLGKDCIGNITAERPDVTVEFEDGSRPIILYAAAGSDTALLVHTPGGQWLCADDSTDGGLNPALTIDKPENGVYAVWVAAVDAVDRPVLAAVAVSELPPAW